MLFAISSSMTFSASPETTEVLKYFLGISVNTVAAADTLGRRGGLMRAQLCLVSGQTVCEAVRPFSPLFCFALLASRPALPCPTAPLPHRAQGWPRTRPAAVKNYSRECVGVGRSPRMINSVPTDISCECDIVVFLAGPSC